MERQGRKKEKTEQWNIGHRNRKWQYAKQQNTTGKNAKQKTGNVRNTKQKVRNSKSRKRSAVYDRGRKADVTVIIPNYQGIHYLEACLKSLYRGSLVPEIIVVDNGSTDGSAELAAKLALQKAPSLRLVRFSENRGFCAAVNPSGKDGVCNAVE